MKIAARLGLALCILLGVGHASAQSSDAIEWSITPYFWAAQTNANLKIRDTSIGQGEISFQDLLDKLDAILMLHVEGGKGNWSVFSDLTYLKISDTNERMTFTVDSESKQVFLDAAFAYWPNGVGTQLSIITGLRYVKFDSRFRFSLGDTLVSEQRSNNDYFDVLVGLRYRFDLAERWSLLTSGDASFGNSEGSTMLRADLAWTVGKRQQNRILFGYQYKQVEVKPRVLVTDFTYHGPMAGFNFRF